MVLRSEVRVKTCNLNLKECVCDTEFSDDLASKTYPNILHFI